MSVGEGVEWRGGEGRGGEGRGGGERDRNEGEEEGRAEGVGKDE